MIKRLRPSRTARLSCVLLVVLFATGIKALGQKDQNEETGMLQGPYLGQMPPGQTPLVFAPGIVSIEGARAVGCSFTPDGNEFYFSRTQLIRGERRADVFFSRREPNGWTKPEVAPFSLEYGAYEPHVSPDGERLFFKAVRPWPESWGRTPPLKYRRDVGKIWYVERTAQGWSEPRPIDRVANQDLVGISATREGTLYSSGIVKVAFESGRYRAPEWLGPPLNVMRPGGEHVGHPFIAPDESYIIFEKDIPGGRGWALHISFRRDDGGWTEPVNLAERMNFDRHQALPMVTPDGKYLFFTSGKDIYWVAATFIEDLRPPRH